MAMANLGLGFSCLPLARSDASPSPPPSPPPSPSPFPPSSVQPLSSASSSSSSSLPFSSLDIAAVTKQRAGWKQGISLPLRPGCSPPRPDHASEVFCDEAQGIVCYLDKSGEILCEGFDEGPHFHPCPSKPDPRESSAFGVYLGNYHQLSMAYVMADYTINGLLEGPIFADTDESLK